MARTTNEHVITVQSAKLGGVTVDSDVGSGSLIYPGHLLQKRANGMIIHGTAGGFSAGLVALPHKTPNTDTYATSGVLQTPYAEGESVYFARAQKGDILNIRILAQESTVEGVTLLGSDGAGHVQAIGSAGVNAGTSNPVGLAWETITTAGSATFVRVLIT